MDEPWLRWNIWRLIVYFEIGHLCVEGSGIEVSNYVVVQDWLRLHLANADDGDLPLLKIDFNGSGCWKVMLKGMDISILSRLIDFIVDCVFLFRSAEFADSAMSFLLELDVTTAFQAFMKIVNNSDTLLYCDKISVSRQISERLRSTILYRNPDSLENIYCMIKEVCSLVSNIN